MDERPKILYIWAASGQLKKQALPPLKWDKPYTLTEPALQIPKAAPAILRSLWKRATRQLLPGRRTVPSWLNSVDNLKILVAQAFIQTDRGFTQYHPGDILPSDSTDADAWVEAGSAVWMDAEEYLTAEWTEAVRATAPVGMPGMAVGGEMAEDNLVGRVPITEQRRRNP